MTALFHLILYIIALATMTLATVSASAATNVAKPKPMTAQVMAWNSVGERCDKHCIAEAGRPNHASVVLIRQGDLVCGSAVVDWLAASSARTSFGVIAGRIIDGTIVIGATDSHALSSDFGIAVLRITGNRLHWRTFSKSPPGYLYPDKFTLATLPATSEEQIRVMSICRNYFKQSAANPEQRVREFLENQSLP